MTVLRPRTSTLAPARSGQLRLDWLMVIAAIGIGLHTTTAYAVETRSAVLEVFLRGDSEKSAAARKFAEETYGQRSGVIVVVRDVASNEKDLDRFYRIADFFQVKEPGLPAFYVSGRLEMGWDAATTPGKVEELLTVEVFVRKGCPRCAAAKPVIFQQLAPKYPGYRFVEQDLVTSAAAQQRLQVVSQRYRSAATSVPALHMCGRLMVGFYDAATSFRQWDEVLAAVTVPTPSGSEPSAKVSQADSSPDVSRRRIAPWRLRRLPVASVGWFGSLAMAGEAAVAAQEEALPSPEAEPLPPPAARPLHPETEPAEGPSSGSPDTAATQVSLKPDLGTLDAPPPRPTRSLPPEVDSMPSDAMTIDPPTGSASSSDVVPLPFIGDVRWKDYGLPAFTIMVGLVDGFNPCAMWVLLFLLSLLVNLRDRWKILAVAGSFVVVSGLAYFAFMAAWLQVFQFIGLLRPAQIGLGLLGVTIGAIHIKDFFAFKKGVSLSIPESAKPGLYARMRRVVMAETLWGAIIGASVLAILVNIVELLCTAGLPAMYTGILTMQNYPAWMNYAYLALYIAAYMFDDALMVGIVVTTLGKHRLQEQGGRVLKLISGLVIFAVGALMLFQPELLV